MKIYICGTSIFRNLNVEEKESFLSRFKKETVNTKIGVIDVMQQFPDLAENFAITNLEDVKNFIKERLNLPKEKADILILAGGGHEKFARLSGIKYEENTLYDDKTSPIMMYIKTRKKKLKDILKKFLLMK